MGVRALFHSTLHRLGLDVVRWRASEAVEVPPSVEVLPIGDLLADRWRELGPFAVMPEEDGLAVAQRVAPFTMTSLERLTATIDAVEYVAAAAIPGAIVECGVWRGGSMMAAALTLLRLGHERDLYLYDTFEGMTPPTKHDVDLFGVPAAERLRDEPRTDDNLWWCSASLDDVCANIASTGYPAARVHYVQGPVEETIPGTVPDQISILRLDTDWYESTLHELEQLYPVLTPGGVLIIDDYGHHAGCKKAVDEYFAETPVFFARTDYSGRTIVKR